MAVSPDLLALDELLNELAKLYQFRSLDDRMYDALTVSQSYCLRILYFQGPRAMGELATELDVRLSTMTGIVDQLEARGLVERVDHPDDRRSLHVTLSSTGTHAVSRRARRVPVTPGAAARRPDRRRAPRDPRLSRRRHPGHPGLEKESSKGAAPWNSAFGPRPRRTRPR